MGIPILVTHHLYFVIYICIYVYIYMVIPYASWSTACCLRSLKNYPNCVDLSSISPFDIHLWIISQEILKISVINMCWKSIHVQLKDAVKPVYKFLPWRQDSFTTFLYLYSESPYLKSALNWNIPRKVWKLLCIDNPWSRKYLQELSPTWPCYNCLLLAWSNINLIIHDCTLIFIMDINLEGFLWIPSTRNCNNKCQFWN